MTIDEGYTKYQCDWVRGESVGEAIATALSHTRDRLWDQGLIGQYPNGIGFGNVSLRHPQQPRWFVVSGTQTGHLSRLGPAHYATVVDWDCDRNWLSCVGPVQASSESLTHGTLYQALPGVGAVLHVHRRSLWERLLDQVPTTAATVPYGTPAMAAEMLRLLRESDLPSQRLLVMAGHEEGILSFGETLAAAAAVLEGAIARFDCR